MINYLILFKMASKSVNVIVKFYSLMCLDVAGSAVWPRNRLVGPGDHDVRDDSWKISI